MKSRYWTRHWTKLARLQVRRGYERNRRRGKAAALGLLCLEDRTALSEMRPDFVFLPPEILGANSASTPSVNWFSPEQIRTAYQIDKTVSGVSTPTIQLPGGIVGDGT